jgi:hypothetical protein
MWKWYGCAKFNIPKDYDSKYREDIFFFFYDETNCETTSPQQIGPVVAYPTITYMLSARASYHLSTGNAFVCIISFMFNSNF